MILTAVFLLIIVDIDWDFSRVTAFVKFLTGLAVPVVCNFNRWSKYAVIVFVVLGGTVTLSWIRTGWGLALVLLAAFLACIAKCGNWTRPSVVSMTTLLFFMKRNPKMGTVIFFITAKCTAKKLSPLSKLNVIVAIGYSKWTFASWTRKMGGSSILKTVAGLVVWICPIISGWLHKHRLLSQQERILVNSFRNPEKHTASLFFVLGQLWSIVTCRVHRDFLYSQIAFLFVKLLFWEGKTCHFQFHLSC